MKQQRIRILVGMVIAAAATLAGCTLKAPEHKVLRSAGELLEIRPDTSMLHHERQARYQQAWRLLQQMKDELPQLSEEHRMRYLLLQAMAMEKTGLALDTLSYMETVADYFLRHGNNDDKAKALMAKGCVYRDRGNSPMALQCLRQAISEIDTMRHDLNRLFVSRIYEEMAKLYHEQRYPQQEIAMTLKAIHFAQLSNDTLATLRYSFQIANSYMLLNQEDSVVAIAQMAYQTYRKMGRRDLAAAELPFLVHYHLLHQQYYRAKDLLDEYRVYAGHFDSQGEIVTGKEQYYNQLGYYYKGVALLDSALWCYRKLLTYRRNPIAMENGYRGLMLTYQQLRQTDSVAKYAMLYTSLNDSALCRNAIRELGRAQALYDYTENKLKAERNTQEAYRLRLFIYWGTAFVALLAILIYNYVVKMHRKNRSRAHKVNQQYMNTLLKYERLMMELDKLKLDVRKYEYEKEEEIAILRQQLHEDFAHIETWDIEQALLQHEIVQQLHRHAGRAIAMVDSEWEDLTKLVQRVMPAFYQGLSTYSHLLNEREMRLCILTRLKFTPSETAVLLGTTSQRISNMRSGINSKLFGDKSARNLEYHLSKLAAKGRCKDEQVGDAKPPKRLV